MEAKKKVVIDFNTTLEEFIIKMQNQFPQETKLKSYYSAFKVSKMYDSTLPIKIFMGGCLSFEKQIKNRDSDFFVNRKTFVEGLTKCTSFSDDIGLVNYWQSLDDDSKKAIWDYIQTLFVMGKMYVNNDTTLINNINNIYNNLSHEEFENVNKNNEFSKKFTHSIN